jgi:hypothetical protein
MAWTLRPFLGALSVPVQFFRARTEWESAYVVVARLVWNALGK